MAFKMKGIPHFTKNKEEWKGATHKMDDGSLHTGKTHNKDSKKLFHKGDSALKKLDHTNTKCWPGKEKVGTKPSRTRPGVTVNDCK